VAKQAQVIRFTGLLEKMSGRFGWTFVDFPHSVQKLFGKKGTVRVKGTVNGVPMDRALMPTARGVHVIVLGGELRKKAKVKAGDKAVFEVWLNPKPEELQLPEELSETLDFLPDFKQGWESMSLGRRRNILIWINQGKTTPTRAKRVAELLKRFETGHAWFRRKGRAE
jgi:hypothetical protein